MADDGNRATVASRGSMRRPAAATIAPRFTRQRYIDVQEFRSQNSSLTPNCICRAGFALKMRPKFGVSAMRFGTSKFTRLSRL